MLPGLNLPVSLLGLLAALRPVFTGPSFRTFCGLAAGLCGQVRRRTVCGMPSGPHLGWCWPHDRAHYFFAGAAWDPDEPGLALARIVVALLVPAGEPLAVAADDSVFRRSGRKVHGAAWRHDGSSPARSKLSYGTCLVTAGIIVALPFCTRPGCLPVLARLHVPGKGQGGQAPPAGRPGQHRLGRGRAGHPAGRRVPRPPGRRGGRGALPRPGPARPAGERDVDDPAARQRGAVRAGPAPGPQARPAPAQGAPRPGPAADLAAPAAALIERYASRWSIEQALAAARNVPGAGEARNRVRAAVERTVPFALLVHTLAITSLGYLAVSDLMVTPGHAGS